MRPSSILLATLACLAPAAPAMGAAAAADPAPAPAAAVALEDGTTQDHWRLDNGLRVMTREVPGAAATVITIAYRIGTDDDPAGREGLADLLSEVAFTAATAEAPERTRDELARLRPIGWSLSVNPHLTLLTEMCRPDQTPGVLHQVAARMSGVQVTANLLQAAGTTVKADLARRYGGRVDQALHYELRLAAFGADENVAKRYASGAGVDAITLAEVKDALAERYVPANAVLAIVGNLSGIDMRRFTASEFGGLPAGKPAPARSRHAFAAGSRTWTEAGLQAPIPAIAVLAPALSDSSHPAFLMSTLIVGGYCAAAWGRPQPPRTSSYRYSLLDDPDIVRFYPPVAARQSAIEQLAGTAAIVTPDGLPEGAFDGLRESVKWLAGGPLPAMLRGAAARDASFLADLAGSMASRPHYGDEAFWAGYRRRLDRVKVEAIVPWRNFMMRSENMSMLVLAPPEGKRDDASSP